MSCKLDYVKGKPDVYYCRQTKEEVPRELGTKYARALRSGGIEKAKRLLREHQVKQP